MDFVLAVLIAHWIADFCMQTHWQAINKSKNWSALTLHVLTYSVTITFCLCATIFTTYNQAMSFKKLGVFFIVTFLLHFCTDAITSRITSRLFKKGDFHNFFVVVGFDQVIHYVTLFLTLSYLGYNF